MPVIRITDELYARLEAHAKGFDTPASVIERILNDYEGIEVSPVEQQKKHLPGARPELLFLPDEETFRRKLIDKKAATRTLHYSDGSVETLRWTANNFTASSNLRGNIWSGPLRGWQEREIVKAEFAVEDK